MIRRRFAFWLGLGLFTLGERLRANVLDGLAARVMQAAATDGSPLPIESPGSAATSARVVEHWRVATNQNWYWFERSELVDGQWQSGGMTLPRDRETDHPVDGRDCADYVLDCDVPDELYRAGADAPADFCLAREGVEAGPAATPARRARQGRPPSRWVRSLTCEELSVWLASFEPPQADVSGMTFFEHLTRDHGFDEEPVTGLTDAEQAKLHGAVHHGF